MMNWKKNLYNIKSWVLKNKRNLVWIFGGLGALIALIASQICIVFIKTNSIPYSVCLQIRYLTPKKYDLCAFKYKGRKFIKYIIATEGDKVINLADAIYVDGVRVGRAIRTNQLTPLDDCEVPEGYVFVSGRHPQSLDSRYKEFGFVKVSDLKGKVIGLAKRDDFFEDTFINWRD